MINDNLIMTQIESIKKSCDYWLSLVNSSNNDAYSDRIVEKIITKADELKRLHYCNRPE